VLGTLPLSLLRMVSVVLLSAAATGFVSIGAAGHSGRQQRKIGEIPAVQRKLSYLCATYCGSMVELEVSISGAAAVTSLWSMCRLEAVGRQLFVSQ